MSIKIESSDSEGQVQVSIRAWDGLVGEGILIGEIVTDGPLQNPDSAINFGLPRISVI
jgi:hypothetical protein